MFYDFTSRCEYPEEEWCRVWELETMLGGILMAYGKDLVRLRGDRLFQALLIRIGICNKGKDAFTHILQEDREWVMEHLRHEIPNISSFFENNRGAMSEGCLKISPVPELDSFLRRSSALREHVQGKARAQAR